jgi:hypothetical protein
VLGGGQGSCLWCALLRALLRRAGWLVNDKAGRADLATRGAEGVIRLPAEHRNHVWSYDFLDDRTHDGCRIRMLNIIDEFTDECLAIRVSRRLKSIDVIDALSFISHLFILRGVPKHIRSDNDPQSALPRLPARPRARRKSPRGVGARRG